MNNKYIPACIALALLFFGSCKKQLDYVPTGVLSSADLKSPTAVEGLVTAAYAAIGNGDMIGPIYSMWAYGSVRSDDAYKGGGGTGDVGEVDAMEHYNLVTPTMESFVSRTWKNLFKSVSRANVALRAVNNLTEAEFPQKKSRLAELKFLRAHSYFTMKLLYGNIPIFDESATADDILKVSNDLSWEESWNKIASDFQFAVDNLPATQTEIGRPNKFSAQAYLAKLRLFQAYEQNTAHKVININTARLQEVVDLCQSVI
ncbi:MAG TPA: RagB/SusD family nutrient uptake outer membrane protein, partial [Niastella sp.]